MSVWTEILFKTDKTVQGRRMLKIYTDLVGTHLCL